MAGTLAKSKKKAKAKKSSKTKAPAASAGTVTAEPPKPAADAGPKPTPSEHAVDILRSLTDGAQRVPGSGKSAAGAEAARAGGRMERRTTGLRSFAEATEHETQVVTFQLAKEEYAIDILQVQEIVMIIPITRMPKAPHFIEGIVNLRGQMIPIIDMRKRFALPEAEHDADTRIIIVNIDADKEIVGMVVDGVRDVIRLPDSAISPPPPMIQGISAEYLRGIGQFNERLLIMLDLDRVLTAEEQEVLRKLGPDGCPLTTKE
jgi:purine-binding chemotaxis protein CheW